MTLTLIANIMIKLWKIFHWRSERELTLHSHHRSLILTIYLDHSIIWYFFCIRLTRSDRESVYTNRPWYLVKKISFPKPHPNHISSMFKISFCVHLISQSEKRLCHFKDTVGGLCLLVHLLYFFTYNGSLIIQAILFLI